LDTYNSSLFLWDDLLHHLRRRALTRREVTSRLVQPGLVWEGSSNESKTPSRIKEDQMADANYKNVIRNWFELYLSAQRDVAASLGLPPQGTASQIDWGKLVLMTAKDAGELPRLAAEIVAKINARG